ncbi:MAG: hypothetical protein CMJ18_22700 [Phycisphaeraceae bacterium]|nr:hypothetical protein [Phycisphaeraceae bacterium]
MTQITEASGSIDARDLTTGRVIPSETYCDQPHIVRTDDGAWLCVMTTGAGAEGTSGQHIVSMRSADCGRTWSTPVDVEPADGPEASYAVLLKAPTAPEAGAPGRIYCFYNHNTDNTRRVIGDTERWADGYCRRVDTQGHFVFKFSDDHGRTWADRRYEIPIRLTQIDRENPYEGKIKFFWNVGRPITLDGAAYVSLIKVGGFGIGMFTRSEGTLLKSENLLVETDPERITWETLPDGDVGLRTPPGGGPIAEEHNFSVLSDGSIYGVYRTTDGRPACAYSRDGGHTWTEPRYERFANGRTMRHPRAANTAWRCANGRFLYWFHNNGTCSFTHDDGFASRSVVWLCGGEERDGEIRWSQPEILLYDPQIMRGCSYPDLIEEDGRYFVTETQKLTARVHEIDPRLLQSVWGEIEWHVREDPVMALGDDRPVPDETPMPRLPDFIDFQNPNAADFSTRNTRAAFTLEVSVRMDTLDPDQAILDSRTESGAGILLQTTSRGTVKLVLNDGRSESAWACDTDMLEAGRNHHLVIVVDGGPRVISFVVDGVLCDGGGARPYGWGRLSPFLQNANGADVLRIGSTLNGEVRCVRIYERAFLTGEAIASYEAEA